ncbi:hypothetical protein G6F57_011569 [Rhizopus arrhizus]|nr:hypothetical protein G6F24_004213 [Rhizopus arrhizus]KAG1408201.1 hypothetical protein G6F58_009529 [Rhizopus delemar]KAG0780808.1 hypothetical protein G6F22_009890 [Rhizopus arrhizus]KAG0891623.1 hypothetical protein G6F34_011540 [Rhizopus arrhizus]KAG0981093.1 hypothetical protein G6F28_011484 [Rhizopus arrhizus]
MFLLTGLSTTLGTQWIFYHGAATGDSYLTQLAQYLGMVLVGFLIPVLKKNKQKQYTRLSQQEEDEHETIPMDYVNIQDDKRVEQYEEGTIQHASIIKLAILDVFANFCVTLGFSIIGSGMYQVIYSSVVIWCAILTFFLMDRKLSMIQWIAIFGTSTGLAISSLDSMTGSKEEAKTGLLMFGTLMTLGGTFFYSCVYVYSDFIMSKQTPPPLPARVCCYTGMYTSLLSIIWIAVYTVPHSEQLINIKQGTTLFEVIQMYILVMVSNSLHSWNYYELIDRTGSVATGILQGLRAVLIYMISNSLYCQTDPAQCFTTYKGLGSILVIGSVLFFTIGSHRLSKDKRRLTEE